MRYKAFISYSHRDERWGARLHKRLETFSFPRRVIGQETERGPVPENVKPIFRDKVELSAGANLSEALQRRLEESENLIVLCSPRAVASHWVNEEILYFKRHNNPDNIFAFIIDGEPYADKPEEECFPPALRFELGDDGELTDIPAEPLAADARKQGEGPRMALLQVLSGMAGLGLDDLVRRDLQRARRRVTGITVGAMAAMLIMGTLTGIALEARGEAEARKDDAEGLIEFMLTDLKDKLEPVGRLDALDAVGQRASDYYDQYDLDALDADSVGRYAKVNHLIGDIQLRMGNITEAKKYFEPVYETTKRQLEADPNNPDRIYEHIQSVFWVAQPLSNIKDHKGYLSYQERYLELARRLYELEGESIRAVQEMAYGLSNVGNSQYRLQMYSEAEENIRQSLEFYEKNRNLTRTVKSGIELAHRYADLADIYYSQDDKETGYALHTKRADILYNLLRTNQDNFQLRHDVTASMRSRAVYLNSLERYAESRELLDQALHNVNELIQIEPKADGLLKTRLRILEAYISLGELTNDESLATEFTERFTRYLDERLLSRNQIGFDREWDFEKPYVSIQFRLRRYINANDKEKIRDILSKYDKLFSLVENRKDLEIYAKNIRTHYLITSLVQTNDVEDFRVLQRFLETEANKIERQNSIVQYAFLSHAFCQQSSECTPVDYAFNQKDLSTPAFKYLGKIYPTTAHYIQSELQQKGK